MMGFAQWFGCGAPSSPAAPVSADVPIESSTPQRPHSELRLSAGAGTCAYRPGTCSVCWGRNLQGELGAGIRQQVMAPLPVHGVTHFDLGFGAACAIGEHGSAYCWGAALIGPSEPDRPRRIQLDVAWRTLSVGMSSACGLDRVGGVWCWERDLLPEPLDLRDVARALQSDVSRACAITQDDELWCWTVGGTPGAIADGVASFTINGGRTCTSQSMQPGHVVCWRSSRDDPLGRPLPGSETTVAVGRAVAELASNRFDVCARDIGGQILCWSHEANHPDRLPLPDAAVDLDAGEDHMCATTKEDEVYCWGRNSDGAFGTMDSNVSTPYRVHSAIVRSCAHIAH